MSYWFLMLRGVNIGMGYLDETKKWGKVFDRSEKLNKKVEVIVELWVLFLMFGIFIGRRGLGRVISFR